jgi:hypothetical protein
MKADKIGGRGGRSVLQKAKQEITDKMVARKC